MSVERTTDLSTSLLTAGLTRRQLLYRFGATGAALAFPGVLAACGSSGTQQRASSRQIEHLTWAINATIRTLDPKQSYDFITPIVLCNSLEGLLVFDHDLRLKPSLAESWSEPDALTYIYSLRDGVTFWDGTPLTAHDVVSSMTEHMDPKVGSQLAFFYNAVKSIEATGQREVTVKLKSPDAAFRYVPAHYAGRIVQKKFAEAHRKDIGTPGVLTMGTGPYRITKYAPGDSVTLIRNENYWGEKPAAKTVVIRFITDDATRLLAMRSGDIDASFFVPLDQTDQWKNIDDVTLMTVPSLQSHMLYLDVKHDPWSDIHVRRTIAYSIDREGLVHAVLGGNGRAANNTEVPPDMWGDVASPGEVKQLYERLPSYKFDLTKARAELAKSRFPKGFTATVAYPDFIPRLGKSVLNLSENLKELGIRLRVVQEPERKWYGDQEEHKNLGIVTQLLLPDYPDPANYPMLDMISAKASPGIFDLSNYRNPRVDALLLKQRGARSNAVRFSALSEAIGIVSRDLPSVPIWWEDAAMAIHKKFVFSGFTPVYWMQPWLTKVKASA